MSRSKKLFYRCEKCGKILIERRPNGLWYFVFGKNKKFVPVEMHIHGNIKMRCLRRSCRRDNPDHWNIFNFFPKSKEAIDDEVESLPAEINSKEKGGED
jgi:hypothetical protein